MDNQILTDFQWQMISSLFPAPEKRGRGKPHTPWRKVVNSIIFVLTHKAKWDALPKSEDYASKSAANRWFKAFRKSGFLDTLLLKLKEVSALPENIQLPSTRKRLTKAEIEEQNKPKETISIGIIHEPYSEIAEIAVGN